MINIEEGQQEVNPGSIARIVGKHPSSYPTMWIIQSKKIYLQLVSAMLSQLLRVFHPVTRVITMINSTIHKDQSIQDTRTAWISINPILQMWEVRNVSIPNHLNVLSVVLIRTNGRIRRIVNPQDLERCPMREGTQVIINIGSQLTLYRPLQPESHSRQVLDRMSWASFKSVKHHLAVEPLGSKTLTLGLMWT